MTINSRGFHTLVWSNLIAAALGIAWAYTAYKYNWLNVGGGSSPFMEQWIAASGIVPYIALCTWLGVLSLVMGVDHRLKLSTRRRVLHAFCTVLIAPLAFFFADWYFHLGFPPAPV